MIKKSVPLNFCIWNISSKNGRKWNEKNEKEKIHIVILIISRLACDLRLKRRVVYFIQCKFSSDAWIVSDYLNTQVEHDDRSDNCIN